MKLLSAGEDHELEMNRLTKRKVGRFFLQGAFRQVPEPGGTNANYPTHLCKKKAPGICLAALAGMPDVLRGTGPGGGRRRTEGRTGQYER